VTDEDFTYIELMNIGASSLDLTGTTFSQGITYTFRSGSLAAGARIILAKNPEAFALRYPSTQVPVVGPYEGDLDNGGERLELTDAVGENILDFEYKDGWYPVTDGSGRSLVLREPTTTPFRDFGNPVVWAISGGGLGDPGIPEKSFAQAYHGWDNFSFTELERDDPTISGMAADPDGDGRDNREEYAFGTDPRTADSPLLEFVWVTEGVTRRPGLRVKRPTAALDVTYELLAAENLTDWSAVPHNLSKTVVRSNQVEEVIFSETSDLPGSSRFLSLRYTVTPQAP
jgi:hypothetical protein